MSVLEGTRFGWLFSCKSWEPRNQAPMDEKPHASNLALPRYKWGKPGMDYFLFGGSGLPEEKGGPSGSTLTDPHDNNGDAKVFEDSTELPQSV